MAKRKPKAPKGNPPRIDGVANLIEQAKKTEKKD